MVYKKKTVLIVMPDMNTGGAQRSLISLLNIIDHRTYEVTLALFRDEGLFMSYVPDEVKVEKIPNDCGAFNGKAFVKYYLKRGKLTNVFKLLMVALMNIRRKHPGIINELYWSAIEESYPSFPRAYDVAIGYIDTLPTWYVVEKVTAKRKIAFNRNDYIKSGANSSFDEPYLIQLDAIVSVSEECRQILCKVFPQLENKITVFKNITNGDFIKKMSARNEGFQDSFEGIRLLTVSRTSYQKGIDIALNTCKLLISEQINFRWYILGRDSGDFARIAKKEGLDQQFIILPETDNPYPYMRQCDIYVQPSRWEGRCNTIMEAKILGKPVVTLNYPTVGNQVKDMYDGLITSMTPESLKAGIIKLINNESLAKQLAENAQKDKLSNVEEIQNFYNLLE